MRSPAWINVVAERPWQPGSALVPKGVAGIALLTVAIGFFGFIAIRDHRALTRGQQHDGTVAKILPAHDWDPFDGGRLVVRWGGPGGGAQTATIWTDNDAADYDPGESVDVVTYGSFVRTDVESNDPAPYGFAFALIGLIGLITVVFVGFQLVVQWRLRRRAGAAADDETPLYVLATWPTEGPYAWQEATTQFGWHNYAWVAVAYGTGGLALGVFTYFWRPGGRLQDTLFSFAVAGVGAAVVMARRLRTWRATLETHPWRQWDGRLIERATASNARVTYCVLTTQQEGHRYRIVGRRAAVTINNNSDSDSDDEWTGSLQVCPDTWHTIVVMEPGGQLRRYALARTRRVQRRWRRLVEP